MAFEDYTIKQFMSAWFKQDYSFLTKEVFDTVYVEYIDAAGLFENEEFEKVSYITYLNNRNNSVKLAIRLQKEFLIEFGIPFIEQLSFFEKFGYRIKWENNKELFLSKLNEIEVRENRFISELEKSISELKETRKKKGIQENEDLKKSRVSFIRLINSLGKNGFKIDNEKTTVEELALMIKQQKEENEILRSK